ncbi:MAG: hypothetical protein AAF790_05200 [Planctomycetota bacterium]
MTKTLLTAAAAALITTGSLTAATIDGQNILSEGLPLLAEQDSPTGFGDSTAGTQDSPGGSELNRLYAEIDGNTLTLAITGNLEGNFNKMFIFFDAVAGGETALLSDNVDGGFNEINNLAGLQFSGASMDHGLRLEIGSGFYGVNFFDLIDNSAFSVVSGGGPGDLPIANVGSGGITVGWDNSNATGVSDTAITDVGLADTGWEFEIDIMAAFGVDPRAINITAFVANGGGDFLSNQVLPGIGGGNAGSPGQNNFGFVQVAVPEPASATLAFALMLSAGAVRRRK